MGGSRTNEQQLTPDQRRRLQRLRSLVTRRGNVLAWYYGSEAKTWLEPAKTEQEAARHEEVLRMLRGTRARRLVEAEQMLAAALVELGLAGDPVET